MSPYKKAVSHFNERILGDSSDPFDDYMVIKSHRYDCGYVKELSIINSDIIDQLCLYLTCNGIQFSRNGSFITLYLTSEQVND